MRIKRPLGLSGFELGIGVFLGVLGGIYIWKPIFEKHFNFKPPTEQEKIKDVTSGENSQPTQAI